MAWTSGDLSDESIRPPAGLDKSCSPKLDCFYNPKFRVNIDDSY